MTSLLAVQVYIVNEIIDQIDSHTTIKVKPFGIIKRFNGIDIHQTRYYTNINNVTYLRKILSNKHFLAPTSYHKPLPMNDDSKYNRDIEAAPPLSVDDSHKT